MEKAKIVQAARTTANQLREQIAWTYDHAETEAYTRAAEGFEKFAALLEQEDTD